jgi:hypothetical protein
VSLTKRLRDLALSDERDAVIEAAREFRGCAWSWTPLVGFTVLRRDGTKAGPFSSYPEMMCEAFRPLNEAFDALETVELLRFGVVDPLAPVEPSAQDRP